MSFFENIRMAFSSIAANKMRALLTMLGIIIGISAVITITTLGSTLRTTILRALSSMGGNSFLAYINEKEVEGLDDDDYYLTSEDMITLNMLRELEEQYPGEFKVAASTGSSSATVVNSEKQYINVQIQGVLNGYLDSFGLKLKAGRNITMADNEQNKHSAIVSDIFVRQYFRNGEEPIGQNIEVSFENGNPFEFTIVGVYKYSELKLNSFPAGTKEIDKVTPIYLPYNVINDMKAMPEEGFYNLQIFYDLSVENSVAYTQICDFFDEQYKENRMWNVYIYNIQDEVEIYDMIINILTIIFSVIAAISLIVGGVGVMNIMLVSVTERTREIGIRKALGAKRSTIKLQFLIEAIIICLIGGVIGILIGLLNSELVGVIANNIVSSNPDYSDLLGNISISPSVGAIVISIIFSTLTGVFFGLYPAGKAAKMDPIDALRYD